jgi:hypothetical protein
MIASNSLTALEKQREREGAGCAAGERRVGGGDAGGDGGTLPGAKMWGKEETRAASQLRGGGARVRCDICRAILNA